MSVLELTCLQQSCPSLSVFGVLVCVSVTDWVSVCVIRPCALFFHVCLSASCMSASRDSTVYRWCLSVPLSVCLMCVRPSVTVRAPLAACLPRLSNCLSLCLSACITGVMPVCLQCLSCLSLCLSACILCQSVCVMSTSVTRLTV